MNFNKKIEAYKLIKIGDKYKIVHLEDDEYDSIIENKGEKKEKIKKTIKKEIKIKIKKKMKINIFEKMKDFIQLNSRIIFRGKRNSILFFLNSFKFFNINKIYNFLFSNFKKIEKSELINLKKLYVLFNRKQLNLLSQSVKSFLSK